MVTTNRTTVDSAESQDGQLNVSTNRLNMSAPYEQPKDAHSVGRAFGFRVIKTMRRGQLPFLLVFFGCVMIFFGALSGFGYVDTTDHALGAHDIVKHAINTDQQFAADLEIKLREMKKLEAEWAAKRRTAKDGAWMKANRDQKAIRRKPLANTPQEKKLMEQEAELQSTSPESTIDVADAEPEVDAVDVVAGETLQ